MRVLDISCARKFRRITSGRPPQHKLFVEDTEIAIRTATLGDFEPTDPDVLAPLNFRETPSPTELCGKLEQQRRKISRYLKTLTFGRCFWRVCVLTSTSSDSVDLREIQDRGRWRGAPDPLSWTSPKSVVFRIPRRNKAPAFGPP